MKIEPFALERFFVPYEFSIEHVMCASDCETLTVGELLELEPDGLERLSNLKLTYSPMVGMPELRHLVAEMHGDCHPEDVIIVTGGGCAIELLYYALLEPGDHVVAMTPCYLSVVDWAKFLGCRVSNWPLTDAEDGWQIDLDSLEQIFQRDPPKLLAINVPHNPTGFLPTKTEYLQLLELAEKHGVRVLSDEIFRLTEYRAEDRLAAAASISEQAISIGSMSKSFGLAGLRIGWIVSKDKKTREKVEKFLDYTSKDSSAVSQVLSEIALRHQDKILERNVSLAHANLDRLDQLLSSNEDTLTWHRPNAGVIAFPRFVDCRDTTPLFERLVNRGVLIAPGNLFQAPSEYFRIGFSRTDFPSALELFRTECQLRSPS